MNLSAQFKTAIPVDLSRPPHTEPLPHQLALKDSDSFVLTALVYDSSAAEPTEVLAGTVTGAALRPDGATAALTGEKGAELVTVTDAHGNAWKATPCSVTVSQQALLHPGRVILSVKLTDEGDTTTVLTASFTVNRTNSDQIVDGGDVIITIDTLIDEIEDAAADAAQAKADAEAAAAAAESPVSYAEQTLTDAEQAQARANIGAASEDDVTDLRGATNAVIFGGKTLSDPVKTALLNIFDHIVYTDGNAQTYIDALTDAWTVTATLVSIEATFTQGSAVITDQDDLDDLRPYLLVMGTYTTSEGTFTAAVHDYQLSGTLTVGTSTITVTAGECTDTFTVTVTEWERYTQKTKLIATGEEYANTAISEVDLEGCHYEYKIIPRNTTASSGHFFSAANNSVPYLMVFNTTHLYRIVMAKVKGTEKYTSTSEAAWTQGEEYIVTAYADASYSVALNGTTVISSITPGSTTPSASNLYRFFGAGSSTSATYRFIGDFFYLKVFDSNDTLIHHFVPAYDNQEEVGGILDLITDTFYTSATTTDFTVE